MIGRQMEFMRRSVRRLIFRRTSDPDLPKSIAARKVYTGSYSDLINLPSLGTGDLQDFSTGLLKNLAGYDPLP